MPKSMPMEDFIIELFCKINDEMKEVKKHSQSNLHPSEIVTIGISFAMKGVGERKFYRWLKDNFPALFPKIPERTRLFRLLKTHQDWTKRFLAEPTILGIADTYGIELVHPIMANRQVGNGQVGKRVFKFKKMAHRVWEYLRARIPFAVATSNILAGWE